MDETIVLPENKEAYSNLSERNKELLKDNEADLIERDVEKVENEEPSEPELRDGKDEPSEVAKLEMKGSAAIQEVVLEDLEVNQDRGNLIEEQDKLNNEKRKLTNDRLSLSNEQAKLESDRDNLNNEKRE